MLSGGKWYGKEIHLLGLAGSALLVTLAGCSSPPEQPTPGQESVRALEKPFTASGNEPFWRVTVEPDQLVLERPGHPREALRYQTIAQAETGRRFRASRDGLSMELVTAPQLCRDSMSGMPHPFQAHLFLNDDRLSGCGGDPKRLIMGPEWVVEDIGGRGIVDSSRTTIQFLPEGRVAGKGSCNQYMGGWSLNGETLDIGPLASTLKACPPALMDQEQRFLRQLESARSFDISPQGALLISSDDGSRIRAFPATE